MFCAGFFHTKKNFFKFFRFQLNKSHLPFPIWCGKRDNHFSRRNGKGVRLMKPSDFQKTVQCRFESCLKKVVRHVVKDYQKKLKRRQKEETLFCELPEIKEHRKAELLPKFSAHVMRHTACTRMAECRMDVKVLQYIMGHAHIDVTMEVYNHIGELIRIENEIARLDSMVLNA